MRLPTAIAAVVVASPSLADEADWRVSASAQLNLMTSQADFVQPTATADRGPLHLEARYNYEALRTASLWAGWSFSWQANDLKFAVTPMIAGVFGDANGFAGGAEWDLTWKQLELGSQNELVFDLSNWSGSDFNFWAEAKVWPAAWLHAGLALQETRAISTGRAVQWGPALGIAFERFNATAYWMNPGQSDVQYWSVTAGASF